MSSVRPRELVPVEKTKEIRFLTLISALARGGTERAAVNYALGYHRAGFPSAIFAYGGGGPREAQLKAEGIPVFVGSDNPSEFERAAEAARAWAPDILHLNRPGIADLPSATALRALIHPRLRVFETNVFGYVDPSPGRTMIDLHLHLSRWCLWKWTQSIQGVEPRSPGVVVPYSVDTASFRPATAEERIANRRAFAIAEDAFVFGRVGQASAPKWSPDLIFAFEAVAHAQPNAWLVVCGLPESLKGLVAKLPSGICSRVIELPITDSDAELRRYYSLMDVFVHVSEKGESFGMVLCEAMLCGIPVITMSTPLRDNSQIEVVSNAKTGLVVRNRPQLISAMMDIQKNKAAFQSMRQNAPESVIERYDIPVVNRLLLTLATIALASSSSQDLTRRLAATPEIISAAPSTLYSDLLKDASLQPSFTDRVLTPLVNQPISRRAITLARAVQSRMR